MKKCYPTHIHDIRKKLIFIYLVHTFFNNIIIMALIMDDIYTICQNIHSSSRYRICEFENNIPILILAPTKENINMDEVTKNYYTFIENVNNCKYFTYTRCAKGINITAYENNPNIITINSCIKYPNIFTMRISFLDLVSKDPVCVLNKNDGMNSHCIAYPLSKIKNIGDEEISNVFPEIILPELCQMLCINIGHGIKSSIN